MTAIAQALSTALLHFVWQGLLTGALLWLALFLMRKRSANSRYLASCAALAALTVLPAVTAYVAYTPAGGPAASTHAVATAIRAASGGTVSSDTPWLVGLQSFARTWAVPVWSLGVLLFSLRLAWGCRQVSDLRRRGEPAEPSVFAMVAALQARLGSSRPVQVLIASVADGPSVIGWLRPVILLPSMMLLGLTPQQLEAVLAHELAHIRRYDYAVNVLQSLVETLLFYHPVVWWTSSRIRHERELCCDDLAVRASGDALCYARALTKLERLRVMSPNLAMAGTGGSLTYRIQRLVGVETHEYRPSKLPGILALALGLACFALNLDWARGQEQEKPAHGGQVFVYANSAVRDQAGVSVDLGGASLIHRSSVEYPGPAIEKGIQGSVVVEATLDAAGSVADARVLSGPPELRRVALQSVLQWHFLAENAGSTRQVTINFDLQGAKNQNPEPGENRIGIAYQAEQAERREAAQREPGTQESGKQEAGAAPENLSQVEAQIRELRQSRERAQAALEQQTDPQSRQRIEAELGEVQSRIQAAERDLASGHRTAGSSVTQGEMTHTEPSGRTLESINVAGLTDPVRSSLMSKLPVHVGDTLSGQTMESITKAVRGFDEHLEVNWSVGDDGQISLRIAAPNSGGYFNLRVR
jgi:TonB family protein